MKPVIVMNHRGQHGDDCYGCKLHSLTFDRGRPKTHVKRGNPWDGNPVLERMEELSGHTIRTDIPPPHLRKDPAPPKTEGDHVPTFEYTSDSKDPVDYTMAGPGAPDVKGRTFEKGEHVEAADNPDPARFSQVVTEQRTRT